MTNFPMNLFVNQLESVQCEAALAITGAMQGTSREKDYGLSFRITKIEKMVQTFMLHVQNNEYLNT